MGHVRDALGRPSKVTVPHCKGRHREYFGFDIHNRSGMVTGMTRASDATSVRIEPASRADMEDLLHLEEVCFIDYYEPHRFGPPEFADYISSERKVIYVARSGDRLAGYVAGVVEQSKGRSVASMDSLAVHPEARRKGTGERLLNAFAAEARQRGCRRVVITVATPNESAIHFFTERGFERVRRVTDYYGKGVDGILMRLDI
jgi:ribosomal-protein-alanine N-acetyltransferase